MKKNALEALIYSVVGVVALLLVLVAFNVVASVAKKRIDLTADKAYTLSDGTKAILAKIKNPITIKFYYSSSVELPGDALFLKTYAEHVQDMLAEYKQAAKGKLIIQQLDPKPDSDAEDAAKLDGVQGQALPGGDNFYLGACVKRLDTAEVIPFFQPDRERLLEYDLSRAISQVVNPDKPVIGIMSGEPIFGTANNPMMEQLGQSPRPAWAIIGQLQNDFTVKQVDITADKIDDDIGVLLVIRPTQITDKAQYAIDQFLMRGGKLAAFVDPVSLVDHSNPNNVPGGMMPGSGSTLDKLIKAWGLQFDDTKALADVKYMNEKVHLSSGENPSWICFAGDALNNDDVVTSQAGELWVPVPGVITGTPMSGLKETVLVKSSKESKLVEPMMAAISGTEILKNFKASGAEYPVAVRLTGKFKTAFPDGPPAEDKPDADTNKPATLKESLKDTAVVLVADSDMLYDDFCLQKLQTPFGNLNQPRNGNFAFVENIVENLAGDSDLISVRCRATTSHPFTRIEQMQAKAEEVFQSKIQEYEQTLAATRQRVTELQNAKAPGQQLSFSKEQQDELTKLEATEADTDRTLKQLRKQLRAEIDTTENRVKWGNIIGMPVLVALAGAGLAGFKRKRTSAK